MASSLREGDDNSDTLELGYRNFPMCLGGKRTRCHGTPNSVHFQNLGDSSYPLDLRELCFPKSTGSEGLKRPKKWLKKCYLQTWCPEVWGHVWYTPFSVHEKTSWLPNAQPGLKVRWESVWAPVAGLGLKLMLELGIYKDGQKGRMAGPWEREGSGNL